MTLSDYLMRLATRYTPAARQEWAQAMRAEFDVLTRGKLSWAFGCLATATGWRLRSEALYLLAIPVGVILCQQILPYVLFLIRAYLHLNYPAGPDFYVTALLPLFALSSALGVWRPNRAMLTGTLVAAAALLRAYILFVLYADASSVPYLHVLNLPPVIGETILLAGCLISTTIGSLITKAWANRNSTLPAQGS